MSKIEDLEKQLEASHLSSDETLDQADNSDVQVKICSWTSVEF